jgi:hypothetical protein
LPPSDTDTAELTEADAIFIIVLKEPLVGYMVRTELKLLRLLKFVRLPGPIFVALLVRPTLHKFIGLVTLMVPPVV